MCVTSCLEMMFHEQFVLIGRCARFTNIFVNFSSFAHAALARLPFCSPCACDAAAQFFPQKCQPSCCAHRQSDERDIYVRCYKREICETVRERNSCVFCTADDQFFVARAKSEEREVCVTFRAQCLIIDKPIRQ